MGQPEGLTSKWNMGKRTGWKVRLRCIVINTAVH